MPEFAPSPQYTSDKSNLTRGRHPAFLCLITEEPIPQGWKMGEKDTMMFRWHFAVWETPAHIATTAPEHQSAVSSRKFSPAGTQPQSKAYGWTTELLGRRPAPGERVNLDPLLPLPCEVKIAREKKDGTPTDYAVVLELEAWAGGAALRTPELVTKLRELGTLWQQGVSTGTPAAPSTPAPVATAGAPVGWPSQPPAHAGLTSYGNPQGTVVPPPTAPTW